MGDKSPLRRWKPFFPAFGAIDASIEAAAPEGCSRDKYRQVRGDIVELLCDAADDGEDDDGRAEGLCRLLNAAMAEMLETLRVVPVTPAMLTTTDVSKGVVGLLGHDSHESGRVRGLARAVLSGWRASIEAALDTLLQISLRDEHEVAAAAPPVTGCVRGGPAPGTTLVQAVDIKQAARILDMECPKTKKMPPGVSIAGHGDDRFRNEETTGDAKRKQPNTQPEKDRECKAEADDVKRQRKVPDIVEHGPRKKVQPTMKSRSRVSSWRSTDERRFSTSMPHRKVY